MNYQGLVNELRNQLGWAQPSGSGNLWINSICPRCGDPKLTVNAVKGIYRCWRHCYGDEWHDVRDLLRISSLDIDPSDISEEDPWAIPKFISPGGVIGVHELPDGHKAKEYLINRGYDPRDLYNKYNVHYCTEGYTFGKVKYPTTDTLIFPISYNGSVVGWQSRLLYNPDTLSERECDEVGMVRNDAGKLLRFPKYFTMPGFRKSVFLYNHDNAIQSELVVVTEGTFDVFRVGRCSVATFGKALGIHPIDTLVKWKSVIVLLDNDAEEQSNMLVSSMLSKGVESVGVKLGEKDPDSSSSRYIWNAIADQCGKKGVDIFKYKIRL